MSSRSGNSRKAGQCCPKVAPAGGGPPPPQDCPPEGTPPQLTEAYCTHFPRTPSPFSVVIQDPGTSIGPAPAPDDGSTVLRIVAPAGARIVLRGAAPLLVPNLQQFCLCTRFRIASLGAQGLAQVGLAAIEPPIPCEHLAAVEAVPNQYQLHNVECNGGGTSDLQVGDGAVDASFHDFLVCGGPDIAQPGGWVMEFSVDGVSIGTNADGRLYLPLFPQITVEGGVGTTDLRIDTYCLRFAPPA